MSRYTIQPLLVLNQIQMAHCGCPSPAPPLCSSPTSRLITSTTEWNTNAIALKVFLKQHMLFLPLHMLPSFTGMGLVTDIAFDSQSPALTQPPLSFKDGTDLSRERVLTWRGVTGWTDAAEGQSESNGSNQTWGSKPVGTKRPSLWL